ncbi:MAG: class I SAM-dependent methyltransferase [Sulfuritalea sp.]|jgi:hypothetical protein|nr:class I SAM-dependent methyltransferase [Sulfuritalea sp.]
MASELWPNDELTQLANRYFSDKGTSYNCAHGYTRVYSALFSPVRTASVRLLEIGLVHGQVQAMNPQDIPNLGCPSLRMWADFLPNADIHGMDIVDFTHLSTDRLKVWQADQGDRQALESLAKTIGGRFDIIIDDGSHASHQQQISLSTLFKHLADGGLYVIEDLHFQPGELEIQGITKTRDFLHGLGGRHRGMRIALDQAEFAYLISQIHSIRFFDSISSRWPLSATADALAVIQKKGTHPFLAGI